LLFRTTIGLGPLLVSYLAAAGVALWVVDGWRKSSPQFRAVFAGSSIAFLLLAFGLALHWNLLAPRSPWLVNPLGIVSDEAALVEYGRIVQRFGLAVYAMSVLLGIGVAGFLSARSRLSPFRPALLTATVLLAFFLTPVFIWLEFTTQCFTGYTAVVVGANLCG